MSIRQCLEQKGTGAKTISGKIRRIELWEIDVNRQDPEDEVKEYFYWDFPGLGPKKR